MPSYRIILGAPPAKFLRGALTSSKKREWIHVSSTSSELHNTISGQSQGILPPDVFYEASRRISAIYENIIFNDGEELEDIEEELRSAFFTSFHWFKLPTY
jgi:hypothetical protein